MGEVLMIGPDMAARGGVASVCATYRDSGLFARLGIRYVSSFRIGSGARKAWVALTAWLEVWRACLLGRVALVHVHAATNMSFWRKALFYIPARAHGVPFVIHLHSGDMPAFLDRCAGWQRAIVLHLLRHAAQVIVLSDEWADWTRSVCPTARVSVLSNPVMAPEKAPTVRRPPPSVLFLGRLTVAKGFPELLEAFAAVRARLPDAELCVGGEGDMAAARAQAQRLGVQDGVRFLGWVAAERKAELLSNCWLFALPSRHEGLPVGVLEAMAFGMPFVATPVGAVPGLAARSQGGLLVPVGQTQALADAMIALLDDASLRRSLGENGRRHVSEFYSLERVEKKLLSIYEELAKAG